MLRAMLVDDEPMALEGLRLLIDWKTEGFLICAECSSAAEALAQLKEAAPDLIVTDIRMSGMDGLELMLQAKIRGYTGQFVIISGYGDFEYAQQALRIGVAGYLLKPIEPTEASEVLEHVRRKLVNRELDTALNVAGYQRRMTLWLSGQPVSMEGFPIKGQWLLATWGAPLSFETMRDILQKLKGYRASVHIVQDKEWLAVHVPEDETLPMLDSIRELLQAMRRTLCFQLVAFERLPEARKEMADQLNDCDPALTEQVEALVRTVSLRQEESFLRQAEAFLEFCSGHGADTIVRGKSMFMAGCARQLSDRPDALAELLAVEHDDLLAVGAGTIRLLAPAQERVSDRVREYVESRLAERLTLEGVADALGYNATYLGRVFRDEQGEGFREWLANLRVERAAELLRETDESVLTIADRVGYTQYKRFLEHFKRRFRTTPEAYRKA